ncbi:MAG: Gx transporter family protein [Spirochaetia bacterium]|jgi:heptaprenyl diphosphate synthase|nr:Gx transporter family protein [Spirochaetia bacterium]
MHRPSEAFSDKAKLTAFLGAFCFFLSAVEYMLPKPLPFMRLGIANLPILIAIDILPFKWFLVLALVKIIGMSIISGTLFSYIALFSLAGTMTAALTMWGVRRAGGRHISQIGVSIAGAMVSNATQILIARFLVFRETAWLIAPLFLTTGLVTGTALGFFSERFARISTWYAMAAGLPPIEAEQVPERKPGAVKSFFNRLVKGWEKNKSKRGEIKNARKEKAAAARAIRRDKAQGLFSPGSLALAGVVIMIAFLSMGSLPAKAFLLLLFALAAAAMGKRISLFVTFTVTAGIVLANLLIPSGRILGSFLGLRITEGALLEGLQRAITFEGLMFISKASIMPGLSIPGRLGSVVAAAFGYYERVLEYKGKIRPSAVAVDADALMMRVWESAPALTDPLAARSKEPKPGTGYKKILGTTVLMLAAASTWALVFFLR